MQGMIKLNEVKNEDFTSIKVWHETWKHGK